MSNIEILSQNCQGSCPNHERIILEYCVYIYWGLVPGVEKDSVWYLGKTQTSPW